jgi:hypothetical protein
LPPLIGVILHIFLILEMIEMGGDQREFDTVIK